MKEKVSGSIPDIGFENISKLLVLERRQFFYAD